VGGGAVACEYASIFLALGARVTLVDRGHQLLPFLDGAISTYLAERFGARGMRVLFGTAVAGVTRDAEGLRVDLDPGDTIRPEMVVFAAGRAGNTEDLGLAEAGVTTDERGRIVVDEHYRTSVEGIFAAGDVIGPPALASVSMEQGRVAACYAMDIHFKETVDPLTPFGVYSIPECAIIGEGATELIHQGQAVMHLGGTIDYFIHSTFDVPTVSDSYKYAAYNFLQRVAAGAP
jgi:NAD(P) transhydrogenase